MLTSPRPSLLTPLGLDPRSHLSAGQFDTELLARSPNIDQRSHDARSELWRAIDSIKAPFVLSFAKGWDYSRPQW
jgi:hypothetical protein